MVIVQASKYMASSAFVDGEVLRHCRINAPRKQ
jgi:hypothetical protein